MLRQDQYRHAGRLAHPKEESARDALRRETTRSGCEAISTASSASSNLSSKPLHIFTKHEIYRENR